jgi:hypothetical protein
VDRAERKNNSANKYEEEDFSIGFLFCAAVMISPSYFTKPKTKPVIIGYVGGFRG